MSSQTTRRTSLRSGSAKESSFVSSPTPNPKKSKKKKSSSASPSSSSASSKKQKGKHKKRNNVRTANSSAHMDTPTRAEQEEEQEPARKPWPYDENKLMDLLQAQACNKLRFYARVLRIQMQVTHLNKSELRALLVDTMKLNWNNTQTSVGVNEVDYATYVETVGDEAVHLGWLSRKMSSPSKEQQLLWGLEATGIARKGVLQRLYEDDQGCAFRPNPYGEDALVDPVYGAYGTRDCGPGYVQVQAGGCCIRIDNLISLWNEDETRANVADQYRGMPAGEAEEFTRYIMDGVAVLNNALAQTSFKSAKEAKFVMELVASMQNTTITRLGAKLDEIWHENAEACEGTTDAEGVASDKPPRGSFATFMDSLSYIGDPVMRLLRGLWWLVRKIFGFAWAAVKVAVGSTFRVLKTVGEKIAFFLVSNPRQARVTLAVAKLVRDRMCTWIGETLVKHSAFDELNAAGQQQKSEFEEKQKQGFVKNVADVVQEAATDGWTLLKDSGAVDPIHLVDKLLNSGIAGKGFDYVTRILGATIQSIPIVGGGLHAAGEIVSDLLKDELLESAKFAQEVLVYQHDFWEAMSQLSELLDLNRCLMKMPAVRFRLPGLFWYMEQAAMSVAWYRAKALGASKQECQMAVDAVRVELDLNTRVATGISSLDPTNTSSSIPTAPL